MTKKGVSKRTLRNKLDVERLSFSGGVFFSIIFLILSILGKFNFININILFDIYGNIGYDVTLFGIILGVLYGFATGYILFKLFSLIYKSVPSK